MKKLRVFKSKDKKRPKYLKTKTILNMNCLSVKGLHPIALLETDNNGERLALFDVRRAVFTKNAKAKHREMAKKWGKRVDTEFNEIEVMVKAIEELSLEAEDLVDFLSKVSIYIDSELEKINKLNK